MKPSMLNLSIFLTAFFIASTVVLIGLKALEQFENFSPPTIVTIQTEKVEFPSLVTDIDATFDPTIDYEKILRTKLITTGDFHAEDVPYRTGEMWLGLFRTNNGYELAPTEIDVKRGPKDALFSTTVSTGRTEDSVFLLRDSKLVPNRVETVFDETVDEFSFQAVHSRSFIFKEITYVMRVQNVAPEGYLKAGSVLTLEVDGKRQLIRRLPTNCDDCSWSLNWAGDLDSDGKLDFLLDLAGHYNSYSPTLFLSSKAKQNELVGIAAGYSGVGC